MHIFNLIRKLEFCFGFFFFDKVNCPDAFASLLSLISPERLAVSACVLEAHLFQLAATVQLIVTSVRLLPEILHVHTQHHLPQLHKITMLFVFH